MAAPNFLFLFADQLQAFALGCMGNAHIRTPNLDALAADGVLFRRSYANSPSCTPYRGILFTGRYASQTGVRRNECALPTDARCLANALNDAGYLTSYVGKWHLGASGNVAVEPGQRGGFQRFLGYQCYNDFLDQVWFFDEEGRRRSFDVHRTTATATLAIERLREAEGRPFAQFVSFQNPHYPLQPSPEFEALYANADIPSRPNEREPESVFTPTYSPYSPRPMERDPNFQRYGRSLRAFHRCYYAMVSQLDASIGAIIRHLKGAGLYDRTVIVFTSDHGEMAGSQGLMNKGVAFEESARVPLIVRTPDGARGRVTDALTSAVDYYPTFLDLAGAPPEPTNEGRSYRPWLEATETPADSTRPAVFGEHEDWIMLCDGDFKVVLDREGLALRHAFDLRADPYERNDLAATSAAHPLAAAAREKFRAIAGGGSSRGAFALASGGGGTHIAPGACRTTSR